jgi:hypothetical protein
MPRNLFIIALICLVVSASAFAQPTAPMQPKIEETPLPPPVTLTPPPYIPPDVPNQPLTADEAALQLSGILHLRRVCQDKRSHFSDQV